MTALLLTISFVPGGLAMLVALASMFCFLVWYAIYKKGDVRAEVSHGKTILKLEAKERKAIRK